MNRNDKTDALKLKLIKLIREIIKSKGWNRREVAQNLNLCEAAVSEIANCRPKKYKIDWLLNIIFELGYDAKIEFTRIEK